MLPEVGQRDASSAPGFWPVLAAVFIAGWIGGIAAMFLWSVIGGYAVVDVLRGNRPAAGGRRARRDPRPSSA